MSAENRLFTSEIPSNLVSKKVSPRIWLLFLTFIWDLVAIGPGFVTNYGSFVAIRALSGAAEGGLLPGVVSGRSSHLTA